MFEDVSGFACQHSNVAVALIVEEDVTAVTLNELEAFALSMRRDFILVRGRVLIMVVERKLSDEKCAAYIRFKSINTLARAMYIEGENDLRSAHDSECCQSLSINEHVHEIWKHGHVLAVPIELEELVVVA